MNTWAIFLSIFSLVNALDREFVEDLFEKIHEAGTACAEETHATPDDIAELIARQIPPSTHEGKCMLFCLQRSFKLMKSDGSVDRPGAILALRPLQKHDPQLYQKVLRIFVTCGMKVKLLNDPCESATALAACGKEEAEAMGLDESVIL